MTRTGNIKSWMNRWLEPFNTRIDSRTAERAELARLLALEKEGHFSAPIFPLLAQFARSDPAVILEAIKSFDHETVRFSRSATNGGYSFSNPYFTSPDAEVAYAIVRQFRPKHIIEVGSGNSSWLFREAITDGGLSTKLVSIDPSPRTAIESVADQVIKQRLERIPLSDIQGVLCYDDILFIDSSHEIRIGNDVVNLLLNLVPTLRKGVIIHLHDIFLPFEYPRQWIIEHRFNWNEQYLVQAMLQGSNEFEVLWPGHFLQRTLPEFSKYFDENYQRVASSLWLRKL